MAGIRWKKDVSAGQSQASKKEFSREIRRKRRSLEQMAAGAGKTTVKNIEMTLCGKITAFIFSFFSL